MNSAEQSGTVLVSNNQTIVWIVNDKETLTIYPEFNSNPETGGSVASVVAFQSDADGVPVRNGTILRFDYDTKSGRLTRFRSNKCDCLRERLEKILSQQRESLTNWLQKATQKADEDLRRRVFGSELCDGGMVAYYELIQGAAKNDLHPVFPAGMTVILNGERWWIADMYCASPECRCYDAMFAFYPLNDLRGTKRDAVCVDYKLNGTYTIREIDTRQISKNVANDLVKEWFENKPVWFTDDEIKSRSKQIKRVMERTIKQQEVLLNKASVRQIAASAGRNEPCPCGSAKKYKVCCGR